MYEGNPVLSITKPVEDVPPAKATILPFLSAELDLTEEKVPATTPTPVALSFDWAAFIDSRLAVLQSNDLTRSVDLAKETEDDDPE